MQQQCPTKCPCNNVGARFLSFFQRQHITIIHVVSFPFTAQYFANSCLPYLFIYVVATYTTNSFKLLHSKICTIAGSTHIQDSTLFCPHRKIIGLKCFHSRSGLRKFFNTIIHLTKSFQYENFPIYGMLSRKNLWNFCLRHKLFEKDCYVIRYKDYTCRCRMHQWIRLFLAHTL